MKYCQWELGWTSYCGAFGTDPLLQQYKNTPCKSLSLELTFLKSLLAIIGYHVIFSFATVDCIPLGIETLAWVTRFFSPLPDALPYRKESGPRDFVCMLCVCVCVFVYVG